MYALAVDLRGRLAAPLVLAFIWLAPGLNRAAAPPVPTTLPAGPSADFNQQPAYEVLDVLAGDVLLIQMAGERREVRCIGTYVPRRGSTDDDARPYTQRLLAGERVWTKYDAAYPLRDRDGRYWVYVYRAPDGLCLNLELLRLGYARVSAVEPFDQLTLFQTYEQHARRLSKGVWAPPLPASQPATPMAPMPTTRPSPPPAPPLEANVMVYVTRSGTRYHRADCQHIRGGNATAMKLADAKAKGLTPCSRCKPPE